MSSIGDFGREIDEMRDNPQPIHPETELDRLEARLRAFFVWAHNRPHPEIRARFESEFTAEPLHDEVVTAIGEGRGSEVRHQLNVAPGDPDTGSGAKLP
jgi:phytoene/squalene synthetase